jgi:hypothetical protein
VSDLDAKYAQEVADIVGDTVYKKFPFVEGATAIDTSNNTHTREEKRREEKRREEKRSKQKRKEEEETKLRSMRM